LGRLLSPTSGFHLQVVALTGAGFSVGTAATTITVVMTTATIFSVRNVTMVVITQDHLPLGFLTALAAETLRLVTPRGI
jgi:hypothetical protein